MLKYVVAVGMMFATGPVFAQGATQSPPAPRSASSGVQTGNSLPQGATDMSNHRAAYPHVSGQALGGATTTAPRATNGTANTSTPRQ